jgi:hypothetical protein
VAPLADMIAGVGPHSGGVLQTGCTEGAAIWVQAPDLDQVHSGCTGGHAPRGIPADHAVRLAVSVMNLHNSGLVARTLLSSAALWSFPSPGSAAVDELLCEPLSTLAVAELRSSCAEKPGRPTTPGLPHPQSCSLCWPCEVTVPGFPDGGRGISLSVGQIQRHP